MPEPTVPYELDLDTGWEYTRNRSGTVVSASFWVKAEDYLTFSDEAAGDRHTKPINLSDPYTYGPWRCPIAGWLVCSEIKVKPAYPKDGILPDVTRKGAFGMRPGEFWKDVLVSVTWSPPDAIENQELDDPEGDHQPDPSEPLLYCKITTESHTKYVEYDRGTLVWEDATSIKVPVPVQRRITITDIVVNFPQIRFLPWRIIRNYVDCVNEFKFLGEQPGKLILQGHADEWEIRSNGISHGATLKFSVSSMEWNQTIDPQTGDERYPVNPTTLERMFQAKDFRKMFK